MSFIESGILDKSKIASNILLIILVAGNLYFSTQYIRQIKRDQEAVISQADNVQSRLQTARFLKFFIDVVLNANNAKGTISIDDRVKLEADVIALNDPNIRKQWQVFVDTIDTKTAQREAVKLMSMLTNSMI